MLKLLNYGSRFFLPLSLIALITGCGDPLDDPDSVESRAKAAADTCHELYERVDKLLPAQNPTATGNDTLSQALTQTKALLESAKGQITELQNQIAAGVAPACEAPDQNIVWRCSNATANPTPVDSRLLAVSAQEAAAFGYPVKGCYARVRDLKSPNADWFFLPVPATLLNSATVEIRAPYNFKTNPTFDTNSPSTDWRCKRDL